MPIYTYKCSKCGKVFEYKQSIKDDSLSTCPIEVCEQEEKGKGEVSRQISKNVAFIFNGKGFYETDYKSSAHSAPSHTHNSETCSSCPAASSCPSSPEN